MCLYIINTSKLIIIFVEKEILTQPRFQNMIEIMTVYIDLVKSHTLTVNTLKTVH
jgi:hypothetical protein